MVYLSKKENFRLGDIMHSSHNAHLSNQTMKCSTGVALYKGVTCFQKTLDGEEIYAKKSVKFSVLGS